MLRRLLVLVWAVTLVACGPQTGVPRGKALYETHCLSCHGAGGRGDGPLAGDLPVALPDLALLRAANGGRFPASAVMTQIHGYPGRFHRGLMPEFAPVLEGPDVAWATPEGEVIATRQGLIDLVAYLETLQR